MADAAGTAVLLLGGGSNLLVADAGFPGTVVEIDSRGMRVNDDEGVEHLWRGAFDRVVLTRRGGKFTAFDHAKIVAEARAAALGLRDKAKWPT